MSRPAARSLLGLPPHPGTTANPLRAMPNKESSANPHGGLLAAPRERHSPQPREASTASHSARPSRKPNVAARSPPRTSHRTWYNRHHLTRTPKPRETSPASHRTHLRTTWQRGDLVGSTPAGLLKGVSLQHVNMHYFLKALHENHCLHFLSLLLECSLHAYTEPKHRARLHKGHAAGGQSLIFS